jgi:hypothetical protein
MDALIQVADVTRRDDGGAAVGGFLRMSRMPWLVRTSGGTTGWPAMEIYAADNLLDVVVATKFGAGVLRGARRAAWDGLPGAIAWGRLPADGTSIAVYFAQHRLRRWPGSRAQRTAGKRHPSGICPAPVSVVGGRFWVATADGRFDSVAVAHHGTHERRRIATVRSPSPDECQAHINPGADAPDRRQG